MYNSQGLTLHLQTWVAFPICYEVDKNRSTTYNVITLTFDPKVELDTTEELFVHKTVPLVGPYENIII